MLEVRDLTKRYGPITALDGATFTAQRGRLVGFLGPNGAGKTTAMRCVFGLVLPEGGDVRWDGAPVAESTRLRFGYMPEQRGLYPRMRVADQLTYFGEQHGMRRAAARASALSWLERLGLAERATSKVEDLSHGNQQRVQLAAALVHDPELLVLDEPFSGLDPIGIATLSEVLRERAAAGVGIVFSSHQLDLVEDLCEDVVIISRGRVVAQGEIDALRRASGRRHLDIEVRGRMAPGSTPDRRHDHPPAPNGRVRLLVDEQIDLDTLLERARAAGEVVRFSFEPPRLSELFMEAVAEDGRPMSRVRSTWLVARREILERGRSRGYVLSLLFTLLLLGASFALPVLLIGDQDSIKVGIVEGAPAELEAALSAAAEPYGLTSPRPATQTVPQAKPR